MLSRVKRFRGTVSGFWVFDRQGSVSFNPDTTPAIPFSPLMFPRSLPLFIVLTVHGMQRLACASRLRERSQSHGSLNFQDRFFGKML